MDDFQTNQVAIAFYVNAAAFLVAAVMISRLQLPKHEKRPRNGDRRIDFGQAFHELKEGWSFIFINPVVRAVNVGLATGLIGGGMLVPLGPVFSAEVLDAGAAGFGILIFALGTGVAVGVVMLSVFQRHIPKAAGLRRVGLRRGDLAHHRGVHVRRWGSRRCSSASSAWAPGRCTCSASRCCTRTWTTSSAAGSSARSTRWCGSACSLAFAVGPFLSGLLDNLSENLFGERDHRRRASRSPCPACGSRCGSPG